MDATFREFGSSCDNERTYFARFQISLSLACENSGMAVPGIPIRTVLKISNSESDCMLFDVRFAGFGFIRRLAMPSPFPDAP